MNERPYKVQLALNPPRPCIVPTMAGLPVFYEIESADTKELQTIADRLNSLYCAGYEAAREKLKDAFDLDDIHYSED